MKTPNTVITITPSRKLLEALEGCKYPYWESIDIGTGDGVTTVKVAARLCTARRAPTYEITPTGGVIVTARTPKPYYGNAKTYTARLGASWTKLAFYRAVTRVWLRAATDTRQFAARNALCKALENHEVPDIACDDDGTFRGHTTLYDEMTAEDVAFWREYLDL